MLRSMHSSERHATATRSRGTTDSPKRCSGGLTVASSFGVAASTVELARFRSDQGEKGWIRLVNNRGLQGKGLLSFFYL